jgi:hypothetical protein
MRAPPRCAANENETSAETEDNNIIGDICTVKKIKTRTASLSISSYYYHIRIALCVMRRAVYYIIRYHCTRGRIYIYSWQSRAINAASTRRPLRLKLRALDEAQLLQKSSSANGLI